MNRSNNYKKRTNNLKEKPQLITNKKKGKVVKYKPRKMLLNNNIN